MAFLQLPPFLHLCLLGVVIYLIRVYGWHILCLCTSENALYGFHSWRGGWWQEDCCNSVLPVFSLWWLFSSSLVHSCLIGPPYFISIALSQYETSCFCNSEKLPALSSSSIISLHSFLFSSPPLILDMVGRLVWNCLTVNHFWPMKIVPFNRLELLSLPCRSQITLSYCPFNLSFFFCILCDFQMSVLELNIIASLYQLFYFKHCIFYF